MESPLSFASSRPLSSPPVPSWLEELAPWFKTTPFRHQVEGVSFLLNEPYAALFDEPGVGKSWQVVTTASILWRRGVIDQVLVLAPASVRSVWLDPEVGQVAQHSPVPYDLVEFHRKVVRVGWSSPDQQVVATPATAVRHDEGALPQPAPPEVDKKTGVLTRPAAARGVGSWPGKGRLPADGVARLRWLVTNYEFTLAEERLTELLRFVKAHRTLLVIDEGAYVKTHNAKRTKRALQLRAKCPRVVLLNGTPTSGALTDLYSQAKILHHDILGIRSFWAFRATYCVMGGYQGKQITGYRNVNDLISRLTPYVLRREKKDCLDLPPKLYQTVHVPLLPSNWRLYMQMRDQMVIELKDHDPVVARHAIVKLIRLSQLTSGLLGGLGPDEPPRQVGIEKLQWLMSWLKDAVEEDPGAKVLVWCRFVAEQQALVDQLRTQTTVRVGRIYGGQEPAERARDLKIFESPGAAVLVGQPQAGGFGLNLQACHLVVYMSNDYNLLTRQQSEDRVHRPGQRYQATYYDLVATGPNGERTIDHAVLQALRRKEDLATWTTNHWVRLLEGA